MLLGIDKPSIFKLIMAPVASVLTHLPPLTKEQLFDIRHQGRVNAAFNIT